MGKQNITLEDILNEYAPQPEKKKPEASQQQAAEEKKPVRTPSPDISDITEKQQYKDAFEQAAAQRNAGPQPHYASRRPPMEVNRSKVSFIQSSAMDIDSMPMRVNVPSGTKQAEPDPTQEIPAMGDTPKIRRMGDSTRAKEMEKRKKKKKANRSEGESYTYDKERPEGEYLYTQINGAKRARTRRKVSHGDVTAVGTETLSLSTIDIVQVAQLPSPELVEPVDVKPAPRAEKTSISLTDQSMQDAESLDVSIARTPEEAEEENRRRQQMMSDRMELENVADIRSDIEELQDAITFRVMALFLVMLISGYLSIGNFFSISWIVENVSPFMMAGVQTLLGLGAAVVCFPVLKNGFHRLITFHADTDSLAAAALTGCLLASMASLSQTEAIAEGALHLYTPCAVLVLLLHSIGKLLIINREETNLRYAAKRFNCYGLHVVEDEQRAEAITRGVLGDFPILATMRHTDSMADFRKYTYSADIADRFCRPAAPAALLFSIAASAVLTALKAESLAYGLMAFSMFASASGCAAITFAANLPLYNAVRRLVRSGSLLLGYQSVEDFYDTNSMMFDGSALFPDGSVKLSGVKMYSNGKPEETLLAAASLSRHAGSVFSSIFKEVLAGKEQKLYRVENFVYEDGMGLCGWIHNQRVLLGNRELMLAHNIEGMPAKNKETGLLGSEKDAVYLSISGNLSAMFLVELTADPQVKYWAKQAVRRNMSLIVHSVDAMLTISRISELFDIPQENIKVLPVKMYPEYEAETSPVENMSAPMACAGSFSGMAQLLIGTKSIRRAALFGVTLQAMTMLLGIGMVLMDVVLGIGMQPFWLLALHLSAAIITILSVNIRRLN